MANSPVLPVPDGTYGFESRSLHHLVGVAELADAVGLNPAEQTLVQVRPLSPTRSALTHHGRLAQLVSALA